MNEIPLDSADHQLERIRAVVREVVRPQRLSEPEIHRGDVLDEPAIEIRFYLDDTARPLLEGWEERARELNRFRFQLLRQVAAAEGSVNAYVRFRHR